MSGRFFALLFLLSCNTHHFSPHLTSHHTSPHFITPHNTSSHQPHQAQSASHISRLTVKTMLTRTKRSAEQAQLAREEEVEEKATPSPSVILGKCKTCQCDIREPRSARYTSHPLKKEFCEFHLPKCQSCGFGASRYDLHHAQLFATKSSTASSSSSGSSSSTASSSSSSSLWRSAPYVHHVWKVVGHSRPVFFSSEAYNTCGIPVDVTTVQAANKLHDEYLLQQFKMHNKVDEDDDDDYDDQEADPQNKNTKELTVYNLPPTMGLTCALCMVRYTCTVPLCTNLAYGYYPGYVIESHCSGCRITRPVCSSCNHWNGKADNPGIRNYPLPNTCSQCVQTCGKCTKQISPRKDDSCVRCEAKLCNGCRKLSNVKTHGCGCVVCGKNVFTCGLDAEPGKCGGHCKSKVHQTYLLAQLRTVMNPLFRDATIDLTILLNQELLPFLLPPISVPVAEQAEQAAAAEPQPEAI